MPKTKPRKRTQQLARKMKAFIIAFAAVITAAYAPQTAPFKRILPPGPTVPHEAPVTLEELDATVRSPSTEASPDEETAKRRVRDPERRHFFARLRARLSNTETRRQSPRRRFSFFLHLRKRGQSAEAESNPDPPSCQLTP